MTLSKLRTSFDTQTLVRGLTAGLVVGIIEITICISLATLVFTGELAPFLARGVGLFLFGSVSMSVVVMIWGSLPGTAIGPQDSPAALVAVGAAGIVAAMAGAAQPETTYATVVIAIALSSIVTGLAFYLIGQFKLGNLVRYIPYPVIGGFLAGTGWLIVRGSFEVMVGHSIHLETLQSLFQLGTLMRWLPGTLFAILVLLILRNVNHFLVWPGIVVVGVLIFYGIIFGLGLSTEEARANGMLLQPFPAVGLWRPILPSTLALVDWNVLWLNLGQLIVIPLVSLIAFLLNASALELISKSDIDLNRELRVAGLSNLLAGLGGAPAGYHLLGGTALGRRMGGGTRLMTVTIIVMCGLIMIAGGSFIALLPASFLNSMLLMLGLSFMSDWLYDARLKLPASDYALIWVILFLIATVGFLEGVGVGIALATILFVFKYASISSVRDTLTGEVYHSKVERPPIQRDILHNKGKQIHIFRLQGYLFFGTANGILTRVRDILEDKTSKEYFIVLDFHRVHSLDSSAVSSFVRMRQLADIHNIYFVLTQVSQNIRLQMAQGGFEGDQRVHFFPNLDFGMEWCENMILLRNQGATEFIALNLKASLRRSFPHPELVESLFKYLERVEADVNTTLMCRGDPSNSMYFIESGRLNIQIETPDGELIRLRSLRGGTVVGEIAMYLNVPRTADVTTVQRSVLYRLTSDSLQRMEAEDAPTASALHEWIARQMAERLADNSNTIEALLD